MLAYTGAVPWHGLGTKVDAKMTGAEMLKVAKLDWQVVRKQLAMRSGKADANGKFGILTDQLTPYRAIVRQDTDEVFNVMSARYHPVQNAQIVDFFREYCEAGHATMETVGGLRGGAVVWALARLNGGSTKMIGEGDEARGYMLLATSHDGSVRTCGKATQVCVVCWNTLTAAFAEKSKTEFRMKHTRKWTPAVAKEAQTIMGMSTEQIQATNELAVTMSKVSLDEAGRVEFITRLMGGESLLEQVVSDQSGAGSKGLLDAVVDNHEKTPEDQMGRVGRSILEAIINSPGAELESRKDTLWGAVNGVTYFADHLRGRTQDLRMQNAWWGAGDDLKTKAMVIAKDMAHV